MHVLYLCYYTLLLLYTHIYIYTCYISTRCNEAVRTIKKRLLVQVQSYLITDLEGCIGDRCHLEVARCLFQYVASQGGPSHKHNVGLDQQDALHVCTCAHHGVARDLVTPCTHGEHPVGQDRRFVCDWVLPERPHLGAESVQPPDGNHHQCSQGFGLTPGIDRKRPPLPDIWCNVCRTNHGRKSHRR